jgi:hypothetical protein
MKSRWDAGRYNLRGRLSKSLSCGCCTIQNLKNKILLKIHLEEMRDPLTTPYENPITTPYENPITTPYENPLTTPYDSIFRSKYIIPEDPKL